MHAYDRPPGSVFKPRFCHMMPAPLGTLTGEQKIKLASELLLQCPPGEFADVLQGSAYKRSNHGLWSLDISVILGDDDLLSRLQDTIEKRNLNSGVTIRIQNGVEDNESVLVLSEFNRLADGRFVEPNTGTAASINPFNLVQRL